MKKILGVVLLSTFATGCVTPRDVSRWLVWEKTIEVTEVRRSQYCGSTDAATRLHFFSSLAAYKAWEATRGLQLSTQPGAALGEGPYVLVDLGQRSNAGHGVAVSRIAGRRKDLLVLKGTFIAPTPGAMLAQVQTSPCVLVSLPQRPYAGVEIEDQSGKLRATSDDTQ